MQPGDVLPADCVLVKGNRLQADESVITGESGFITKRTVRGGDTEGNPFLISGSKVVEGGGQALVCCVGKHDSI